MGNTDHHSPPTVACIICGSRSPKHASSWKYCSSRYTIHNPDPTLVRDPPTEKFLRRDGSRICYNWNGEDGCHSQAPSCDKGSHTCSICDSQDHKTQRLSPTRSIGSSHRSRQQLWQIGLLKAFTDVNHGIQFSFGLSKMELPILSSTIIHKNHPSATNHPEVIDTYIKSELALNRYFGPFTPAPLEAAIGHFRASPLGAVPKHGSDKFRIVQDISYPATNTSLPTSVQGATFDVDSAFRTIPIHPEDRKHTVIVWRGVAYVDGNLAFGTSSSGGIFGQVAGTLVAILTKRGIGPAMNWDDDFLFIRVPFPTDPYTYPYNETTAYNFDGKNSRPDHSPQLSFTSASCGTSPPL